VEICHLRQFTESLNGCFTNPTGARHKSTFGLTAAAPTVGQRNSISPEKGTILKSWNYRGIHRLARAKIQHAFYPCPAQRQMQTLRRDVCSARQLRGEMRNHGITINHTLLASRDHKIREIAPRHKAPSVLESSGKLSLSEQNRPRRGRQSFHPLQRASPRL
jgi:hypothetical protein